MTKIAGRYEIRAKLGEGGMGVVFRAYDPPPVDREVAVKTLHELSDPFARELFYKECAALKSISHPNICEIFDIGEYEDGGHTRPFFVMPLLPGQTLDDLIRKASHRLTVERVVEIFAQTCRGLQAAHDHGLVHRDLKPSNLFVMADDSVKIIDFGVAHAVQARSQLSSYDKGTLLYMAPEQVQRKAVSAQSDIYSLGVTLYEALTHRQPFKHPTEDAVIHAITKQIPPPASDLNPAVSQIISRVVHKAMAKQPWNRFDTAREFGETLQKAARNEPIALFDPARTQPRIETAMRNLEKGDFQFADEIVTELEAEGNIDPQITLLRAQIDQIARQKTVGQLLESARARFEEQEDPLALQKIQEVLQLDSTNVAALSLKSKIEDRRSERQIEKWIQLAQQHAANRSYAHAREALQNALALRPKDVRASRLLKEVERDEHEYLRLRKEKADLYQSAVNAWQNGEVSQALSHMRVVLDLDRQAPDASSPETANAYQSFYNKIRSEHDAMNNAYAEARRALADQAFARATQICEDYLVKYPGQALFQALKFDIEEQQRQRLSSFVADVDRRLDAEADLEAKLSLVREAVEEFPEEQHFKRLLRMHQDKRDLVNSIAERARLHESGGQLTEAVNDLETLGTIYAAYPGLKFEKDRLRKRLEQQTRDSARAKWIKQIDDQIEAGDYEAADAILAKAEPEFPGDADLAHFRSVSAEGAGRAKRADQLAAEGQQLCEQGRFDEGVSQLRAALQLDERSSVRLTLRDVLASHAQQLFETDWREADRVVDQVLELDPKHPLAKSLRARALDRRREETISESGSRARRLQAEGKVDEALREIEQGLADNPGDTRLALIAESIKKDRARIAPVPAPISAALPETPTWKPGYSDPKPKDPGPTEARPVTAPPVLAPPAAAESAPDQHLEVAGGLEQTTIKSPSPFERTTISTPVVSDGGDTSIISRTDVPPPDGPPTRYRTQPARTDERTDDAKKPAPGVNMGLVGAAAGVALLLLGVWFVFLRGGSTPTATTATVALRNWPADVGVSVDGQEAGRTGADGTVTIEVKPGRHTLTFARTNYYPESVERELSAGQADEIGAGAVNWRSVPPPPPPPLPPGPDPKPDPPATFVFNSFRSGTRVIIDGSPRVSIEGARIEVPPGTHTLIFQQADGTQSQPITRNFPSGPNGIAGSEVKWSTNAGPTPPVTRTTFSLSGWPAGVQVIENGRVLGTVAEGVRFSADTTVGDHTFTFQRDQDRQIARVTMVAGDNAISPTIVSWHTAAPPLPPPSPATGTIRFRAESNVTVTVRRPDGSSPPQIFKGFKELALTPGTYLVDGVGASGLTLAKPMSLAVKAGENTDVEVPYVKGIESLTRSKWRDPDSDGWYSAEEGNLYLNGAVAGGHLRFVSKVTPVDYGFPFAGNRPLAWFVGYVDNRNYTEFQLDVTNLTVIQMIGGAQTTQKIKHGLEVVDGIRALAVEIDLTGPEPIHRVALMDKTGTLPFRVLALPTGLKRPISTAGQFGFHSLTVGKLKIKDFRFDPVVR